MVKTDTKKVAVKTTSDHQTATVVSTPSKFEGGPIFAGTMAALAATIVLTQFGALAGLSLDSPLRGTGSIAAWGLIAAGGWFLWVQLLSSILGGYLTGRLRSSTPHYKPHENEMRDGIYGLITWATSTFVVFLGVYLATMASGLIAGENSVSNAVETMSDADRNAVIITAFISGSVSVLGAAASWWAATVGGEHRDGEYDFGPCWTFKR